MQMEGWLAEGDLRSDGASNEVVDFVLQNPHTLEDLVVALQSTNPVVRGHAADALEKVSRSLTYEVDKHFHILTEAALHDEVPMVRWHLAMLLGYLAIFEERWDDIGETLLRMLGDESVFVLSWVITSLTILASIAPGWQEKVVDAIDPLKNSDSVALRTRARKSIVALTNESNSVPENWIKSPVVQKELRSP